MKWQISKSFESKRVLNYCLTSEFYEHFFRELSEVKMQNSSLAAKASALEASSAISKQAEEVE